MNPLRRWSLPLGLALSLAGAGLWLLLRRPPGQEPTPPPATAEFTVGALPATDLSKAEAAVRSHLQRLHAECQGPGTGPAAAAAWNRLGEAYFLYGFHAAAGACFTNALALNRTEFRHWQALAETRLELGEFEAAADAMARAIRLMLITNRAVPAREYAGACGFLAEMAERMGDLAGAVRHYDTLLQSLPNNAYALLASGQLLGQLDDPTNALRRLERAATIAPGRAEIRSALASALRRVGQTERADALKPASPTASENAPFARPNPWRESLASIDESAITKTRAGSEAAFGGRWAEAGRQLESALRAAPGHLPTQINLAGTRLQQGRVAEARALYEEVLRESPNREEALWGLALAQAATGAQAEALRICADWQARQTNATKPVLLEAVVRQRTGDFAAAEKLLLTLIPREPGDPTLRTRLATAQAARGHPAEARATLESALRDIGNRPDIQHSLARLLITSKDDAVRDPARGLALIRSLNTNAPTVQRVETAALGFAAMGQWEEAEQRLQACLKSLNAAQEEKRVEGTRRLLDLVQKRTPLREDFPFSGSSGEAE